MILLVSPFCHCVPAPNSPPPLLAIVITVSYCFIDYITNCSLYTQSSWSWLGRSLRWSDLGRSWNIFFSLKWSDEGPYRWSFREGISFSLWQVHTASDHRSLILAINMSSPTSISMLSSYAGLGWMAFFLPELATHWLKMADCNVLVIRPPASFNMIVLF